jgi:hypothetical protein
MCFSCSIINALSWTQTRHAGKRKKANWARDRFLKTRQSGFRMFLHTAGWSGDFDKIEQERRRGNSNKKPPLRRILTTDGADVTDDHGLPEAAKQQLKAKLTADCSARKSRNQVGVTTDGTDCTDTESLRFLIPSVKSVKSVVRNLRQIYSRSELPPQRNEGTPRFKMYFSVSLRSSVVHAPWCVHRPRSRLRFAIFDYAHGEDYGLRLCRSE